jgi:hypothetical protein
MTTLIIAIAAAIAILGAIVNVAIGCHGISRTKKQLAQIKEAQRQLDADLAQIEEARTRREYPWSTYQRQIQDIAQIQEEHTRRG